MPVNRLSKVLAAAGVASRRASEELIVAGRVVVNGATVLLPQHSVDPEVDHIKVDGKRVGDNPNKFYFVINKPKGFICTNERPKNGRIVRDLFPKGLPRLFTVGRLDKDTTGLLIVTNDGHFGHQVIHPTSGITKEYLVKVREELDGEALEALRRGAVVDDVFVRPVSVVRTRRGTARVTVSEGRKHEVRILVEKSRLTLVSLERIRVGSIVLGELPLGAFRPLTLAERKALLEAAAIGRAKPKRRKQIVVRRPEHAKNVRPAGTKDGWEQEEREPMSGQDIGEELVTHDAIEQSAPDIQWEQVTLPEQEPAEGVTPRREKRAAFAARQTEGTPSDREPSPERGPRRSFDRPAGRFGDRGPRREFGDRTGAPRGEWGARSESRFGQRDSGFRSERAPYGSNSSQQDSQQDSGFRRFPREEGSRPQGEFRPRFGGPRQDRPFRDVPREGGFNRAPREGGFDRAPREGGFNRTPREGGFNRAPREGGFNRAPREGGFDRAPREGGFNRAPREGGFDRAPREGGFNRAPREGGFNRAPREGGFNRAPREGGFNRTPREGGFDRAPREGGSGFGERRERSGFAPRENRGGFGGRPPRPSFGQREDRPFRGGSRPERNFGDRPRFEREEGAREEASPLKPRLWRSE